MRTILLLLASLLVATNGVFADEKPNLDDPQVIEKILGEAILRDTLEERGPEGEKLFYAPNSQTPYTGWSKRVYDNGLTKTLGHAKDGKADGPFIAWHENGQKWEELNYKDGKQEGLWTGWHENGQKEVKGNYKDGKPEGLAIRWHENGEKASEATFKDGKLEGLAIRWDSDGKVVRKALHKDGVEVKE